MSDIRPGLHVDFFYYADYERENFQVMRSVIYDIVAKKIIMAQSSPVILKSGIKKNIVVTYLTKKERDAARVGFNAKITDLITNYSIASGDAVPAILIEQEGPLKPFNIRLHYRVRVPSSSDLKLMVQGESIALIDISIGGALISGKAVKNLNPHDKIQITVRVEDNYYDLEAEALRIWTPGGEKGRSDVQYAALKFLNASRLFESALGKAIFTIERQMLADDEVKPLL